jgi:HEPN domain-containing protein
MNSNDDAYDWLEIAKGDLMSAQYLIDMIPPQYNAVCFHAQQAAEKAIKGVLVLNNISVPKTHSMDVLCGLTENICPQFNDMFEKMAFLDAFSVASRYPNEMEISRRTAEIAINNAELATNISQSIIDPEHKHELLSLKRQIASVTINGKTTGDKNKNDYIKSRIKVLETITEENQIHFQSKQEATSE